VLLDVVATVDGATLQAFVERATAEDATVYTDEWPGYSRLAETGREHATVCHTNGASISEAGVESCAGVGEEGVLGTLCE
jgi:hypothetical protein